LTSANTVLVKFIWSDRDPVEALRAALGGERELRVFRAVDTEEACAYIGPLPDEQEARQLQRTIDSALPNATASRLWLVIDLPGASAGAEAPYHYVVETDVRADCEADFNAWYDREHLPGLASVPGTVRAMRFRNVDDHPRYHACYDLVHRETLGSSRWLAVRGTPWSDRVRPAFFNTRRTMFRRV